jgi:multidrug resistance efflux pump
MFAVGVMVLIVAVVALAWFFLRGSGSDGTDAPLTTSVIRGPFEHVVIEQGEVESSNNVEIRCEVRARAGSGPSTSIIDVIPEGTWVEEGDWLVTFDSSTLEQEHRQQKIAVNTSEANMIQAKATYDTAVISKKEYLEGTYREEEKTILNEIFVAEENLKKAQLSYDSIKRLVSRGLLTPLQLEGEKFRVDAANNELELAKRKLEVLEQFTKVKMLTQLESDVRATEVKWKNEQESYQEELKKLEEFEEQIAKCTATAPQAGQVVYANVQSSRSGSEFIVEAGAMVRERQVIIRLPDPKQMQINAKINESRINLVREGMPVKIRIDAFGDTPLEGEVTKVNKYAEPGNWWSAAAKQYATFIQIKEPPPQIRVGLTAEVQIQVEKRADILQVPVQAVYERGGKTFCLVEKGDDWDTREIVFSTTNDKTVAIDEDRSDVFTIGDKVVVNPRRHVDKFDASRLPQESGEERSPAELLAATKKGDPSSAGEGSGGPPPRKKSPLGEASENEDSSFPPTQPSGPDSRISQSDSTADPTASSPTSTVVETDSGDSTTPPPQAANEARLPAVRAAAQNKPGEAE